MRNIDFSRFGGFPLTQDGLDFMQKGWQNPINAFGAMGGSLPHIISGMVESAGSVSDGYLFYNGEPIPFVGGAVGATIVINTYNTVFEYGDGNSYSALSRKEASFGAGAVQFNYADIKLIQEGFGARARTGWRNAPFVATNASCLYVHNKLTNTVHVQGSFRHSQNMGGIGGDKPIFHVAAELPPSLAPSAAVFFNTGFNGHALAEIYTQSGSLYLGETGRLQSYSINILSRKLMLPDNPQHYYYFSYQL